MNQDQFRDKYHYASATPVMRQFLDIKYSNIDCLILFRMGDFYELFYEDAVTASRVLGIALTKRGKAGDNEIAMCGVPHHALENYLNKLLEDGFKVAICDQTETPEEAKKRGGYKAVVNRSIVRIITSGTVIEESLIESGEPNYLVSIALDKNIASIAAIDLSTSVFSVISLPENQTTVESRQNSLKSSGLETTIINEIARISPKEILISDKYRSTEISKLIETQFGKLISFQVNSSYASSKCEKNILDFYGINSLSAIGELSNHQISAVGSILEYVMLTQKDKLPKLPKPKILNYDQFMSIDASTRRNLEITVSQSGSVKGSLFSAIDKTLTKAGKRLLYQYISAPLIDITAINKRLEVTKFFNENILLTELIRKSLKKTGDLERCLTRLNMGRSTPKDLLSIKYTIEIAEQILAEFITQKNIELPNNIRKIINGLSGHSELHNLIESSIKEDASNSIVNGKIINPHYHPKIMELYSLIDNNQDAITALRDKYRSETNIDTLKINNNNVLGLFIDITSRHADKILSDQFIHRQTTASSIRYTTKELQELENKIVNAQLLVVSLEQEIYKKICHQITENQTKLLSLAKSLSILDVYCGFAIIADENDYTRPELSNDIRFDVIGGRHPVVESHLKQSNESFVDNDCNLSIDERIWLITGPNMSGKSTYLRQNAIIAILAHIGSYVPAKKACIGIVDKIFSRIGAGDDLNKGQSTFMLEMLETSAILTQSSHRSLIILDEVGRGTSTYDGVAIAWSVLEHIHDKTRARCLFATHYHELVSMEDILPALENYTVSIEENEGIILFLHRIKKGSADKSYGVHVAELAGLPKPLIKRATGLLQKFEKNSTISNKKIMQTESYNMNLFEMNTDKQITDQQKELLDKIKEVEPDKLTPREALNFLYQLKNF